MADIVFNQTGGDAISLQADRVRVTGRINLPSVAGAEPPRGGEVGDLVITVEEFHNQVLNTDMAVTRLWLRVKPEGTTLAEPGQTFWREVQLGSIVVVNG